MALTAIYVGLHEGLGLNRFIIVMNGAFIGAGVAFIVAFYDLFEDAILTRGAYDRVRQMALSMLIIWLALALGTASSIYGIVSGGYVQLSEFAALSRYLAILGGVAQITSPDVGQPLLYGRDRKLLLFAIVLGIVASIFLIVIQT
jgi:hypothetical protein